MSRELNGRITEGVYQSWGGACQCFDCRNKTRREGFYRARHEEYEQAAYGLGQSALYWAERLKSIPPIMRGEKFEDYERRVKAERRAPSLP